MNNKQREILHQHRHFLTKNVQWSDDITNKFVTHGVITETILKEIQNGRDSKQQKKPLAKLLEALPVRGAGVFDKFCDVLLLNGHPFIADFLRDEERGNNELTDVKELYKTIPALDKHLKENDKLILEAFVNEKVKESNLKGLWSKEAIAREKNKAIDAKQQQLEDAFDYEGKEKRKNEEITEIDAKLKTSRNDVVELTSQLGYKANQLREMDERFRSEFGVQLKYNSANENALQKMRDKNEHCEKVLQQIDIAIKEVIHIPQRNSERDQMAVVEFKFAFIKEDLNRFIEKYQLLQDVEKQCDKLLHERNYILAHLGHSREDDKPSLLNAYRDFAVKTDEDLMTMKEELQKHTNTIEGQQEKIQTLNKEVETNSSQRKMKQAGTVWQNAMMSVMRKQLSDVKHENRVKDTRIKHFESEMTKLKARNAELETARSKEHVAPSSHYHQNHHNHKEILNHEQNRLSPGMHADDNDSETSASTNKRNTLLPPLGGKILFQTADIRGSQPQSPRRSLPKQHNGHQKSTWAPPNIAMPEGLMTNQLKIENKGTSASEGKLGNMGHGLGGLKAMHGKHSKPTHVRT